MHIAPAEVNWYMRQDKLCKRSVLESKTKSLYRNAPP